MEISKLVKKLNAINKKYGNINVALSIDREGNGFNEVRVVQVGKLEEENLRGVFAVLWP
jgi:hypothetical protein